MPKFGVVDDVIEEPLGGAHRDPYQMANRLKLYLAKTLRELSGVPTEELVQKRYEKFRKMGVFVERLPENTVSESTEEEPVVSNR